MREVKFTTRREFFAKSFIFAAGLAAALNLSAAQAAAKTRSF